MIVQPPSTRRCWHGIECDDPPEMRHAHDELCEMAGLMLSSREKRFPQMVTENAIGNEAADRQLAVFRGLAAHWIWIATGTGEPASHALIASAAEALDESLRTLAVIADRRGGFDVDLAHQAACVVALRWHADWRRDVRLRALTTASFQLRQAARKKADA